MNYDEELIRRINSIPLFGDRVCVSVASWYSCFQREHLHGFTLQAWFSQMTDIREFFYEATTPRWERKHPTGTMYCEAWLLLEKDAGLYVDHLRGIDSRYFYGVLPCPPKISEILLPSPVFDVFRDFVGAERWLSLMLED